MNNNILNILYKSDVTDVKEFFVDLGEYRYLIMFGCHKNGYFCALPNRNSICDIGAPDEVEYNKRNIFMECGVNPDVATAIAEAIQEVWERG